MKANNIKQIRERLGLSQASLAAAIGVRQSSVSNYERGTQQVSPDVARRVITVAREHGISLTFDDVYAAGSPSVQAMGVS